MMMRIKTGLLVSSLLFTNLAFSHSDHAGHEGHEHHGLSPTETRQQADEGKLCIHKKQGYSLGAVVEHEGKIFRCLKGRGENMQEQQTLVWVELMLKDNTLVTAP